MQSDIDMSVEYNSQIYFANIKLIHLMLKPKYSIVV